jgi:ribonuclease P protein component
VERRLRLRRSVDVRRTYDEGTSWAHPLLVLVARPNQLDTSRVAFVAGRRVGNAVARNRAKRLMREAARALYPRFDPGWDMVLVARRRILSMKTPQVESALASLARRAGITSTTTAPDPPPQTLDGPAQNSGRG